MNDKNIIQQNLDEEKELDSLFEDVKTSKLKKAVKKAKRYSTLKIIIICFLVIGVVAISGPGINRAIVDNIRVPAEIATDKFNEISAPNQFIGVSSRYSGFLSGRTEYTTYKIIEGKVVYTGENEYFYGLFKDYFGNWQGSFSPMILGQSWDLGDLEQQRYNELGQREMVFFYPFVDYSKYKNDLLLLDDIPSTKVMEMALSFDKEYTIEEVNAMLPHEVTLAWYWLDDLNEQEKQDRQPRTVEQYYSDGTPYTIDYLPRVCSEQRAYGIMAYDRDGTFLEDPEQTFVWALKNGMVENSRYKYEFERVYTNIAGADGDITMDDFKIFGVVVTGDTTSLKSLEDMPYIKATSLGVITDRH